MQWVLENNLINNILFLIVLVFFTAFSYRKGRTITKIGFTVVTIMYVFYIYRAWF